jgi:hypothetical protein
LWKIGTPESRLTALHIPSDLAREAAELGIDPESEAVAHLRRLIDCLKADAAEQ